MHISTQSFIKRLGELHACRSHILESHRVCTETVMASFEGFGQEHSPLLFQMASERGANKQLCILFPQPPYSWQTHMGRERKRERQRGRKMETGRKKGGQEDNIAHNHGWDDLNKEKRRNGYATFEMNRIQKWVEFHQRFHLLFTQPRTVPSP